MENLKTSLCRTCLGYLDNPINLYELKYKNSIELLNRILGFQIKEASLKICKKCDAKLRSVQKFKDVCIKSLETFINFEVKQEPIDNIDNSTDDIDNSIDDVANVSLAQQNEPPKNLTLNSDIHKKALPLKVDQFDWNVDSIDNNSDSSDSFKQVETSTDDYVPSKRGVRLDQFPRTAVLEAITEQRSFYTKAKHRTCLHCKYVGKTARALSVHMSYKHCRCVKSWCYQCNIQTHDIEKHKKDTQCFEFFCKFCGKHVCPIKRATEHLRYHCSKESTDALQPRKLKPTKAKPTQSSNNSNSNLWHRQCNRKDILQAISELKRFYTDVNSTSCLHCGYIGETARGLSIHMSTLHRDDAINWCYRCNIQTLDLEAHKNTTKCFLYFCKFCDKYACTMKHATTHLESHCHGLRALEDEELLDENSDDNNTSETGNTEITDIAKKSTSIEISFQSVQLENTVTENVLSNFNLSVNDGDFSVPLLQGVYPHETVEIALKKIMKPFYTTRQCPVCDDIALNLRHLQKHIRLKHRDLKNTWCSRCNSLEDNYSEHFKIHNPTLFQCLFCDKSFDTGHEIKNHMILHSDTREIELKSIWFNCKYCPQSFPNEDDLKNHKCPNASARMKQIKYQRHLITRRLNNDDSNSKNSSQKIRKTHARRECKNVNKLFKKTLTKKPRDSQLCSICGKVIRRLDFKAHMKIHNGTMFKCNHCDKQFTHKIYLIEHVRRHTGEKPFLCDICGKAFITSGECKRHERIHEGGPQQCPVCDVQCNRPERLKLHMKRHTGENKFSCAHCGISFHIKSLLLKHIKTHTDERPFKCSYCDNYFKHREEVKFHERNHTGIRPYACTLCPYTGVRSKELTNHMKKHPEDAPQANTPYKCQLCTKKFSTNAMLVAHTKNQHEFNS